MVVGRGRHRADLHLRHGVKWHDGQPFTAPDIECTEDLILDKGPQKLRFNPDKSGLYNLTDVTTNGDWEVTSI